MKQQTIHTYINTHIQIQQQKQAHAWNQQVLYQQRNRFLTKILLPITYDFDHCTITRKDDGNS